jgi:hypothetical protein
MSLAIRKSIDWSEQIAVIEMIKAAENEERELTQADFTNSQWEIAKIYIKDDWTPSKYAASKKSVGNSCASIERMFARIKFHEDEIPAGIMSAVKILLDDLQNLSQVASDYTSDDEEVWYGLQKDRFEKISLAKK